MKDNCPTLMQTEEMNAPWNEKQPILTEVDCTVCYCMSKSFPITVNDYNEDTNFIEEFKNDGYAIGIPLLLAELQTLCSEKLARLRDELDLAYSAEGKKKVRKEMVHYLNVLSSSKDWIVDDMDVCKDD